MDINVLDIISSEHIKKLHNYDISIILSKDDKYLVFADGVLSLHNNGKCFHIDFNSIDILNRINPRLKKCSVIQAVEGNIKNNLNILDATAGLGRDMFTLASRNHNITAIEQDIYIFLLLTDAIHRAKLLPHLKHIADNITLLNCDSNKYITDTIETLDCIYLDPMFPPRTKSAKVKQNMQILHTVVVNNEDENRLLCMTAIDSKKSKKVIVKRPAKAELLSDKKPSSQMIGKANRFDIYCI